MGAASSGAPDGKVPGFFSGVILLALICYSLFVYLRPLVARQERDVRWVLLILVAVWAASTALLPFFGGFGPDIGSYQAWAIQITAAGPAQTYHSGYFLDYPPGYLYALWAAGLTARALGASGTALRAIVESPALIANLILAAIVFAFIRRSTSRLLAYMGMLFVAFNPALLFDTVVWGQTDSAVTALMFLSVALLLDSEYELCWGVAALSVLVKPQALMLLPVLGWWTVLRGDFENWWRATLTFLVVFVIGIAPFQMGHPLSWIPSLYAPLRGAAYYSETSVNAFNLIALIGGLRQPDTNTILGVSFFDLGMALLVPLYGFACYVIWRKPSARALLFSAFIVALGFFMLAPRMHERYLYPAIVFAIPLAVGEPRMLAIFVLLTMTCLFNLAYVKHALETVVFLKPHDPAAMLAAALNLVAFALSVRYRFALKEEVEVGGPQAEEEVHLSAAQAHNRVGGALRRIVRSLAPGPLPAEAAAPMPWLRADTVLLLILLAAAAATRFWRLGHPHEIVFDEVHFVGQARHYLRGEPFLDPHPPLAKLIIATGILLFGDHSWSWRVGNAILGTILVGVTYLLGRRMFHSRMTAALAAAFVLCDGMFIVDSRIAVIDIVYVTLAAISYLLLFRFMQSSNLPARRRTLVLIGVALGLCLASKLFIPAVTFLLVTGFLVFFLARHQAGPPPAPDSMRVRHIIGALALVGSVATIFYLAVFLPNYFEGWWGGITDLFHYYGEVIWYEGSLTGATHPYASPWWSWPLMLRPVAYWQRFPAVGDVATIWGAGNPVTWWGALTAIAITAVRAIERPSLRLPRAFLVIGYLSYLMVWMPALAASSRILFLYHYMPSVYFGYIALAAVLSDCWSGETEPWERVVLLATIMPAIVLGLGKVGGTVVVGILLVVYMALVPQPRYASRFVCVVFLAAAGAVFVYYFPLWVGMPITRNGYYARMWLMGPSLRNWI